MSRDYANMGNYEALCEFAGEGQDETAREDAKLFAAAWELLQSCQAEEACQKHVPKCQRCDMLGICEEGKVLRKIANGLRKKALAKVGKDTE